MGSWKCWMKSFQACHRTWQSSHQHGNVVLLCISHWNLLSAAWARWGVKNLLELAAHWEIVPRAAWNSLHSVFENWACGCPWQGCWHFCLPSGIPCPATTSEQNLNPRLQLSWGGAANPNRSRVFDVTQMKFRASIFELGFFSLRPWHVAHPPEPPALLQQAGEEHPVRFP